MHRCLAVLGLAACGGHSTDLGDGVSGIGLSCDQPTKLLAATASIPRLAAAASGGHIAVGWTADDATLGSAKITLDGGEVASIERDAYATPGNWTGVSFAMTASATLVALGRQDGHTIVAVNGGTPADTTVQLLAPGAAIATGGSPDFALAGNDSAAGKASMIGISADGTLTAPVATGGSITARVIATRIKDGLAAVDVQPSNSCGVIPVDSAVTRSGAAIAFGANGRCTQAAATFVDDATGTLLVHHDDSGAVIAIVMKPDRTLGARMTVASPALEPRTAATSAGTWVTYATSGMLEAALIDGTGAAGKKVMLGAIGDATSQTVVTAGDTAYALWLDGDLEIARLCP